MAYSIWHTPYETQPRQHRTLRPPPAGAPPGKPGAGRAGGTTDRAIRVHAPEDAFGSGHGDRRRHPLSPAPEARDPGALGIGVAGGGAQEKKGILALLGRPADH